MNFNDVITVAMPDGALRRLVRIRHAHAIKIHGPITLGAANTKVRADFKVRVRLARERGPSTVRIAWRRDVCNALIQRNGPNIIRPLAILRLWVHVELHGLTVVHRCHRGAASLVGIAVQRDVPLLTLTGDIRTTLTSPIAR